MGLLSLHLTHSPLPQMVLLGIPISLVLSHVTTKAGVQTDNNLTCIRFRSFTLCALFVPIVLSFQQFFTCSFLWVCKFTPRTTFACLQLFSISNQGITPNYRVFWVRILFPLHHSNLRIVPKVISPFPGFGQKWLNHSLNLLVCIYIDFSKSVSLTLGCLSIEWNSIRL